LENSSGFQKDFLNKTFVKKALGAPAEEIVSRNTAFTLKNQKEFEELRKKKAEAEQRLSKQNELVLSINERLNKENSKIAQLKDLPEYEEEIKRKEQLTKNLQKTLKRRNKRKKRTSKKI